MAFLRLAVAILLAIFIFVQQRSNAAPHQDMRLASVNNPLFRSTFLKTFGPYLRKKLPKEIHPPPLLDNLDIITDFEDTDMDNAHGADKRQQQQQQFDDYGHLRFGKRGEFDDYGHLRFGRSTRSLD